MGQVVGGKYEILRRIAKGGMAQVFLARQKGLDGFEKLVVIKTILPEHARDDHYVRMFLDEARVAADLRHPNVVGVFEVGESDGTHYIAMEYLHGQNLRRIAYDGLKGNGPLPLVHALHITHDVAAGLQAAHTKRDLRGRPLGIVHRDISPHNVVVTYDGAVKIVDFGVAKAATQRAEPTRFGELKGKYRYMAPEQVASGAVDARTDLFALGVVLFEITTMRSLFDRASVDDTLDAITRGDVPRPRSFLKSYPQDLEDVVMRALALRPADRFQDALSFLLALEEVQARHRLTPSTTRLGQHLCTMFAHKLAAEQPEMAAMTPPAGRPALGTRPDTVVRVAPWSKRGKKLQHMSEEETALVDLDELDELDANFGEVVAPRPEATQTRVTLASLDSLDDVAQAEAGELGESYGDALRGGGALRGPDALRSDDPSVDEAWTALRKVMFEDSKTTPRPPQDVPVSGSAPGADDDAAPGRGDDWAPDSGPFEANDGDGRGGDGGPIDGWTRGGEAARTTEVVRSRDVQRRGRGVGVALGVLVGLVVAAIALWQGGKGVPARVDAVGGGVDGPPPPVVVMGAAGVATPVQPTAVVVPVHAEEVVPAGDPARPVEPAPVAVDPAPAVDDPPRAARPAPPSKPGREPPPAVDAPPARKVTWLRAHCLRRAPCAAALVELSHNLGTADLELVRRFPDDLDTCVALCSP